MMHLVFLHICVLLNISFDNKSEELYRFAVQQYTNYLSSLKIDNISFSTNEKKSQNGKISTSASIYRRLNDQFIIANEQLSKTTGSSAIFPYFFGRNSKYYFELARNAKSERIVTNVIIPAPTLKKCIDSISDEYLRDHCAKRLGLLPLERPKLSSSIYFYFFEVDYLQELRAC